ncbi:threonine dehydrogenase-like Zn-dependent dehydrogenase [Okibacterium sp. HSC-33S16]|uniref:zinc-dependent alcohol dehydrogenase family protein n=1 Tax=Okibacterium sp. HSC-33S16 TaxID=2910965 RepID=UPI00209D7C73|nr:zinc-dependent alcohol dehydrogenase family protein [Okibacterium sp. HSC-33S16]MCP2030435.1 threonine dehydrogenase-like Zn-dependent dehydrogenase [Okibacterium sp. HSC-33S16]
MRAVQFNAPGDVSVVDRPEPTPVEATDAIVRVVATCVCGSDLWPYRGETERLAGTPIGHEFVGVVEEIGREVSVVRRGDFVIAPFQWSDNTCANCVHGFSSVCMHGGGWDAATGGGQGEFVRVPLADGTLVTVPGGRPDETMIASLLSLSDVFATGHHAAVSARVGPGATVAVVGDGAVGLSGVLAAQRLGAERIITFSRYPDRQRLAMRFGATDIIATRGDDAVTELLDLTGGVGADATLECVGTGQSMTTAFRVARAGSIVGFVGVPHGVEVPVGAMFRRNVGLAGGVAPARSYAEQLLPDVLAGSVRPGEVFDYRVEFDSLPEGYRAMDERRAIKAWSIVS